MIGEFGKKKCVVTRKSIIKHMVQNDLGSHRNSPKQQI